MSVPRHPPLPVYDPERDGNVFHWLRKAAQQVREQRNGAIHAEWAQREAERRARKVPHGPSAR